MPGSQHELKETLLRDGPAADRIVIGAGDGTISNALPELLQLDKPLAVLPLGTANDFARSLGLPQDNLAAARVALHGRTHRIDVGLVNGRPFLNVASVGVAAKVNQGPIQRAKTNLAPTLLSDRSFASGARGTSFLCRTCIRWRTCMVRRSLPS